MGGLHAACRPNPSSRDREQSISRTGATRIAAVVSYTSRAIDPTAPESSSWARRSTFGWTDFCVTILSVILLALVARSPLTRLVVFVVTLASPAFAPGSSDPEEVHLRRRPTAGLAASSLDHGTIRDAAFAIEMVDTDAHFRHWIGWGISLSARGLRVGQHPPHEEGRNTASKPATTARAAGTGGGITPPLPHLRASR